MKDFMKVFAIFSIDIADLFAGIDACAFSVHFLYKLQLSYAAFARAHNDGHDGSSLCQVHLLKEAGDRKNYHQSIISCQCYHFLALPWHLYTKVFAALKCKQIGARSYLTTDFSVECWVGEHGKHVAIVFLALAIYVLGIPLLTLMVLRWNRVHLFNKDSQSMKRWKIP